MSAARSVFFSSFRLDLVNEQLWRGAQLLAVRPKTFAVLRYLVEHPSRLVTRDELCQAVWPDTVGSEQAPKHCIRELRQLLGEEPTRPRYIETLGRRGWRWIAETRDWRLETCPPSSQASSLKPLASSVVGRDTELTQLHGWLAKALQGERQLVFVTGEPGIGKTALLEAFRQRLETGD